MAVQDEIATIKLASIDWDTSAKHCQIRQCTQSDVVEEYATAMKAGVEFPPIIVFTDGTSSWLVDGYHRCEAATDAGIYELPVDLREGSLRDATLFAVGVNAAHGVRRTNDDKRRAVLTLLNDESWSKWSDNKVAKKCCVSQSFVSKMRSTYFGDKCETRTYERDGEVREMNVANIGKPKNEPTSTAEESRPADDGGDTEDAGVELPDIGEVKLVPTGFVKNYVNDEDEGDEETHESFSGINRLGDFYDSLFSRLKPILADRNSGELLTIQGHLEIALEQVNDLIEQLEAEKDK